MSAKDLIKQFNYRLEEFGQDNILDWFEQLSEKDKTTLAKAMWVSQWKSSTQAIALQCSSLTQNIDHAAAALANLNHEGVLHKGCCELIAIIGMLLADLEGFIELFETATDGKIKAQQFLGTKTAEQHDRNRAVAAKYLGRERMIHLLSGAALAEIRAEMEGDDEDGDKQA